jgi:hypothetical protein
VIDNPAKTRRRVQLSATVTAQPGIVTIRAPGRTETLTVTPDGTPWRTTLELHPGTNTIDLVANVPRSTSPVDPRRLVLQVADLALRAPALNDALCTLETGGTRPVTCP